MFVKRSLYLFRKIVILEAMNHVEYSIQFKYIFC